MSRIKITVEDNSGGPFTEGYLSPNLLATFVTKDNDMFMLRGDYDVVSADNGYDSTKYIYSLKNGNKFTIGDDWFGDEQSLPVEEGREFWERCIDVGFEVV